MKKTAPKKSSKTVEKPVRQAQGEEEGAVKPEVKVAEPDAPETAAPPTSEEAPPAQAETKKKEPEIEVIADYSGSQTQAASSPAEDSAEQNTEVESSSEAKEVPESTPEKPAASVASDATTDEPKKEEAKTADVPSIAKDAPLKIDSAEQSSEEEEEPKLEKSNKKIFIVGIIITILVILVATVFGFYFLKQGSNQESAKEEKAETTPTPTPKPKISIDRAEWSLEVLNGTATPGLAKDLADKLEALGYEIVLTGNADNKDYENSQILVTSEKDSEEIDLLLKDIKSEIDISSSSGDLEDSTASARIIIGSDYNIED